MTNHIVDTSQRKAAKVAGFMYLFTMATGIFSSIVTRSDLIVPGNAEETANNIMANEWLFRIGIAVDLITFASIVLLPLALYILLKPVSKNLALLGLFWRLGEAFILGIITLNSYFVLTLLSGADYLTVFDARQLQALAQLFINAHETGYNIGLISVALGTLVFNYLFFKSNYIPRILAVWGIFASLVLLVGTFAILILPTPPEILESVPYVPGFIYEVTLGLWLLFKGVNIQQRDNRALESQPKSQ